MRVSFEFSITDILLLLQGITLCESYFETDTDLRKLSEIRSYIYDQVRLEYDNQRGTKDG